MPDTLPAHDVTCPLCGAVLPPVRIRNPITHEVKIHTARTPCETCHEKEQARKMATYTESEKINARAKAAVKAVQKYHPYYDGVLNK